MMNSFINLFLIHKMTYIWSLNLILFLQVKAVVQEKREEYVVDRNLEEFPIEEINHVFTIAWMCLEAEPCIRPTMAEVVKMLEQIKVNALA